MVKLEEAWKESARGWPRRRPMMIQLVAPQVLNAEQIAGAADLGRRSVVRSLDAFLVVGVPALLMLAHKGGRQPMLAAADRKALLAQQRDGNFRRAKDAQAWIEARTGCSISLPGVNSLMGKAGGS